MSYGVQVWTASAELILDISDRLTRYVETHRFVVPIGWYGTATITVPGLRDDGTWFPIAASSRLSVSIFGNNTLQVRGISDGGIQASPLNVDIEIFRV